MVSLHMPHVDVPCVPQRARSTIFHRWREEQVARLSEHQDVFAAGSSAQEQQIEDDEKTLQCEV
jgi:hypothetical protein